LLKAHFFYEIGIFEGKKADFGAEKFTELTARQMLSL
jgi:hypothetical protein